MSLLLISCSSIYPLYSSIYQEKNNPHHIQYYSNDYNDEPATAYPRHLSGYNSLVFPVYNPRRSRSSWFRVSTYKHMKPAIESDEKYVGDNVLRWG